MVVATFVSVNWLSVKTQGLAEKFVSEMTTLCSLRYSVHRLLGNVYHAGEVVCAGWNCRGGGR